MLCFLLTECMSWALNFSELQCFPLPKDNDPVYLVGLLWDVSEIKFEREFSMTADTKEGVEQMQVGWRLLLLESLCFLPRKLNLSLWGFLFPWQAARFPLAPVKDQLNHNQLVKIFHIKKEFQMLLWDWRKAGFFHLMPHLSQAKENSP